MKSLFSLSLLAAFGAAHAQFVETEANETKATANAFSVVPGSTITGNTTGTSTTVAGAASADTFRLNFGAAAPAIYRNQLAITLGNAGHTSSIRGLSQTAGVINAGTDATFQVSTTTMPPVQYNQFYTFGAATSLYYRVTGTPASTVNYTSTLTQTVVTPIDLGSFAPGTITFNSTGRISTTGTARTDTSVLVLDAGLNPIANYSNEDAGSSDFGSTLARPYAAGTYYFAISNFALASHQAAATDDVTRSNPVLDFAGVVANASATVGTNLNFTVTDANGARSIASTKAAAYDVNFYRFTVAQPVPEPATLAALGLGAVGLLRRKRK